MALTEYAVINPRRRRRRKRARATTHRRVTRRRRRRALAVNPRPRRRRLHARRRHHSRRRRHNPRGIGGGSVVNVVKHAAGIVAGGAVAELGVGFISKYLPAGVSAGPAGVLINAGIGVVGIPMLLRMTPLRRFAPSVAIGAAVVVLWNAYQTYVKPHLPLAGLGVYEEGVSGLGVYGGPGLLPQNAGIAGLGFGQDSMYSDSMYT